MCPKKRLRVVFFFLLQKKVLQDLQPGGGGTAFLEGSHFTIAETISKAEPNGMTYMQLFRKAHYLMPFYSNKGVKEVAPASAGDVVLMHPFMVHAVTQNFRNVPRIAIKKDIQVIKGSFL